VSWIFTCNFSHSRPSVVLPSPDHFTVAARFCPLLFELRESKSEPVISLPYRMIFAIATKCSVYLYDTQQKLPFGLISNIHYTRLTDLTWSNDGNTLLVSSTDGYCSIVQFSDGELGKEYKEQKIQDIIAVKSAKNEPKKKKKSKKTNGIKKEDSKDKSFSEGKENSDEKMEVAEQAANISLTNLPESIKEIVPVDKIIKSNDIFSPQKQLGSPATPIQVRKFPRNLDEADPSPNSSPKASSSFKSNTPTRIEVRRQPRVLQPTGESPKDVSMPSAFGSLKSKKKLL
jgi:chromatin assembly factor 1 subunit B